jgi:hypothetical protein
MYLTADALVAENPDTNYSWSSMMTHELAQEILERDVTLREWQDIIDALDDGVYDILMSFNW